MTAPIRIEHDLLGDRAVPADAYYGVHTLRALENFAITGTPISIYPELVMALACVKQAAAIANAELGLLDERRAHAIRLACEEVREGKLFDEFVVDVIQGGAGTSSNMNANEVICNRALELLGHQKGEYQHLHPLDHVNLSQSTNDVYSIRPRSSSRCSSASTACLSTWRCSASRSKRRPPSSARCSRSGERSCRTRCR
jgi:aspartate ammonia-lyase